MTAESIERLDRMLEDAGCGLSIEDIGDLVFTGKLRFGDGADFLPDVLEAGLALCRLEGLPLALPVPPRCGFFLVALASEIMSEERIERGERGIGKLERRIRNLERKYGGDELDLLASGRELPAEWRELNREWERIADEFLVETLRDHAADMAALFVADQAEFGRRREQGRLNFARLIGRHHIKSVEETLAELDGAG